MKQTTSMSDTSITKRLIEVNKQDRICFNCGGAGQIWPIKQLQIICPECLGIGRLRSELIED